LTLVGSRGKVWDDLERPLGGALVVSGDAGVGKTALIEAAMTYAVTAGLRVLRATSAQFEANVSFSGLHQLLFPLLGSHLDELDDVHRAALRFALGCMRACHRTGLRCPTRRWNCSYERPAVPRS
jgi:hypothetical protein